jgi:hypothetical protein
LSQKTDIETLQEFLDGLADSVESERMDHRIPWRLPELRGRFKRFGPLALSSDYLTYRFTFSSHEPNVTAA